MYRITYEYNGKLFTLEVDHDDLVNKISIIHAKGMLVVSVVLLDY